MPAKKEFREKQAKFPTQNPRKLQVPGNTGSRDEMVVEVFSRSCGMIQDLARDSKKAKQNKQRNYRHQKK